MGLTNLDDITCIVIVGFIISIALSTFIKLFNLWLGYSLSAKIATDFSCEVYTNALYDPYEIHAERNSAQVVAKSTEFINSMATAITNFLILMAGLITASLIVTTLIYIEPRVSISAFLVVFGSYSFIAIILKSRLSKNSLLIANLKVLKMKLITEGLGSIRDIILDNSQNLLREYKKREFLFRRAISQNSFYSVFLKHL